MTQSLWTNIELIVVDTEVPLAEVLACVPDTVELLEEVPRRMILAEKHYVNDGPLTTGGAFQIPGFTIVVPPTAHGFGRVGFTHWPEALSQRFGQAWLFSTSLGVPAVMAFEHGQQVAAVTDDETLGDGLLGVTAVDSERPDDILAAMGRLLGGLDVKHLLRQGTGFLYRASP